MPSADNLLALLSGPGITLAVMLGLAAGVLGKRTRSPGLGWSTLGAGLLVFLECVAFVTLALPVVWTSWWAQGQVSPILVLLSLAWFAALAVAIAVLVNTRRMVRYLMESYHADRIPRWLQPVRRWAIPEQRT